MSQWYAIDRTHIDGQIRRLEAEREPHRFMPGRFRVRDPKSRLYLLVNRDVFSSLSDAEHVARNRIAGLAAKYKRMSEKLAALEIRCD